MTNQSTPSTIEEEKPEKPIDGAKPLLHSYDDGNIVLCARDEVNVKRDDGSEGLGTKTFLFRVHKSLLALHSPVFRNMLDASSPSSDDTYHDVPIVEMPDKAHDIQLLLDSIYTPMCVCQMTLLLALASL